MHKSIKSSFKWLITLLIVVVSFYFALKDIDLNILWKSIVDADYVWALASIPIIVLSHYIRALRWRTILKPISSAKSTVNLFSAVMVGYFFNSLYPRLGEFVRPIIYAKRENLSRSSVFATIIVERVIDVITLGILFAIAFTISRDKIANMLPGMDSQKILFLSLLILILIVFSFYPPITQWLLKIFIKPFSQKIYDKLSDIFEKFTMGFSIIKDKRSYLRLTVESILIWICYAIPMYLTFYCFPFSSEMHVTISDALFLVIISGIGVTIAPTPSGIGVMHSLIMYAMMGLYGISEEMALAYATVNHAMSFFTQLAVGGGFLLRERVLVMSVDNNFNSSD